MARSRKDKDSPDELPENSESVESPDADDQSGLQDAEAQGTEQTDPLDDGRTDGQRDETDDPNQEGLTREEEPETDVSDGVTHPEEETTRPDLPTEDAGDDRPGDEASGNVAETGPDTELFRDDGATDVVASEEANAPDNDAGEVDGGQAPPKDISDPEPVKSEDAIDEPEARTSAPAETPPEPAAASPASSVIPLVLGGLIAGLIGFGIARYMDSQTVEVEGPTPTENAALLAAQEDRITELQTSVETLSSVDLDEVIQNAVDPVDSRFVGLEGELDGLSSQLSELSERVETIAMRPTATGIESDEFDDALAEFRTQMNAAIESAQAEILEAREEAQRISEEAFRAEQSAMLRAAWAQVTTSLENGGAFDEALATVSNELPEAIPPTLSETAESGVPTLAELQEAFPDAARDALDASVRADTGEAPMDRLTAFLRVQTGVRSLAPREGDDPDAVLSRAEAALRQGDLASALAEVESLPEAGRSALSDWEDRARTRLDAMEAAQAVSDLLNSN